MSTQPITCYRCQGRMSEGFVVDEAFRDRVAAKWYPGAPVRSFWFGPEIVPGRLKPMAAWRCDNCGLVELYAK